MEQHEGVYEQIIEVNNTNPGNELLSSHLVQEIVVQNDNNQGSTENCEMSGIEIILPNDCINIQEQCNSNIIICNADVIGEISEKQIENVILQQEVSNDQSISQTNNIEENITNCNENLKEQKIEDFILQNQTSYQENLDVNNSVFVTNTENDNQPVNNDSLNKSQNTVDNSNEIEEISSKESEQVSEKLISNKTHTESSVNSTETESIQTTEGKAVATKNDENKDFNDTINKLPIQDQNHCTVKEEIKSKSVDSNNCNVNSKKEDIHSIPLPETSEKVNSLENIRETSVDNIAVSNSDDVAVLTEFSTMEYDVQEDEKTVIIDGKESIKKNEEVVNKKSVDSKQIEDNKQSENKNLSIEKTLQETENNDTSLYDLENNEEEDLDLHLSADQSTENHRKVIQDIFDDWQDENGEEETAESSTADQLKEQQDAVEMELQSLLSEEAQQEVTTNVADTSLKNLENSKNNEDKVVSTPVKTKVMKTEKSPMKTPNKTPKSTLNSTPSKDNVPTPKNPSSNLSESKQKLQSPRPGVKVPGSHLTSQIVSTAEVTEVLKERLREKQKDLVTPKTADIVFVKKITQRLSSQLSAAAASGVVPPLVPLQTSPESEKNKSTEELSKTELNKSTDNNDLLAILEGDVDPDWSNLKPHGVIEDSNKSSESHGSKLDPVIERELALKQLLELPSIPSKKNSAGKPTKQSKRANKSGKDTDLKSVDDSDTSKDVISLLSEDDSPKKDHTPKTQKENNSHNTRNSDVMELSVEESRSGRKRKLTEKAREHELTVKRQKVVKGKTTVEGKKVAEDSSDVSKQKSDLSAVSTPKTSETPKTTRESSPVTTPKSSHVKLDSKQKKIETTSKQTISKTPGGIKGKITPMKRSKIGLALKKDATISKRKLAVKNLLRQKKATVGPKAKTPAATPKTASSNKNSTEKPEKPSNTTPAPRTKKIASEIDRLLQDEGVVNLLYDVEQPDSRKRYVPITKSQKKVMDVEKAERELKLRTKLVRNAVLRLRNSGTSTFKISSRSRRNTSASTSAEQSPVVAEKKVSESKSPPPLDFIMPAKIRNAADASRIIRRHSSSSFSSASASPRVSIDQPPESFKIEEPEVQTKSKRKLSHDSSDKETKKGKKKIIPKSEPEAKDTDEKSPTKKEPVKKITTRSNVAAPVTSTPAVKLITKNKKVPKNKSSTESSPRDVKSPPKSQDELSACLAEAASALLSSISGTTRSSSGSTNRKKGSTKTDDEKIDTKKIFSNKEINVRQHGHLVQLILTPSSPVSGIRNAITVPVMNELREALSILKKDDDCRVVLFTSTGTSFCEGLELSSLLHSNKDERKARAEEMADAVKEFIKSLASFNKPIVAGVQGAAIGLGVTMLPLFDLVIASDKATFSTPYGKLGQIAEGAAVLTLSHSLGSAVTNELLLGGRVLTASEALRAGLVTRVLWPDRFQGELLPSLKAMSEQSAQSMEATKALLRHSLRQKLDIALKSENYLLVQHWCSSECQDAIKAYIDEKGQ